MHSFLSLVLLFHLRLAYLSMKRSASSLAMVLWKLKAKRF